MTEYQELTQSVVRRAKALMLLGQEASGAERMLDNRSIIAAILSLGGEAEDTLRMVLKVEGRIIWSDALTTEYGLGIGGDFAALEADAEKHEFALAPSFKKAFNAARRRNASVEFSDLLREVLENSQDKLIQQLCRDNGCDPRGTASDVVDDWRDRARLLSRFQETLREEMPDQPAAVDMLMHQYRLRCQFPRSKGPRGIFTVLGPEESDKAGVARALAAALSKAEGTSYIFCDVSQDGTSLLNEGVPHGVLLFPQVENLEKLQQLAQKLDKGECYDAKLANTWVVFTTDLGRRFFDNTNESDIIQDTRHLNNGLFELLEREKIPVPAMEEKDRPKVFPSEMISLMRKGGVVALNRLSATGYINLINRHLDEAIKSRHTLFHSIDLDDDSRLAVLLDTLPGLHPDQVGAATQAFADRVSHDALARYADSLKDKKEVLLQVRMAPEGRDFLQERLGNRAMRILLLDDGQRMEDFFRASLDGRDLEFKRSSHLEGVVDFKPDLTMLNLDLVDAFGNNCGLAMHGRIKAELPGMPVFLFSEDESLRKQVHDIVRQGGARGFFILDRRVASDLEVATRETSNFSNLLRDFQFDNCMENLRRQSRRVVFETGYQLGGDTGDTGLVNVILHSLQEKTVLGKLRGPGSIDIPDVTLANVYGLERAKGRLRQAIQLIQHPQELRTMSIRPPSGYLLDGPPGTGKTMLARSLAGEARIPFFHLSANELLSKWYGESEERIRDLFDDARQHAPSIIFIDEIDAIASSRGHDGGGHTDQILNQLLTCMDGFVRDNKFVFVLAATNRADMLDAAIRRPGRFDEIIPIDLPGPDGRREMLRGRLTRMFPDPENDEVQSDQLANLVTRTAGMSPASIDRVIRESGYFAVARGESCRSREDLNRACNLVKFGAEKEDIELDEEDQKRTAWHEAGHALVKHMLFPKQEIDYVTIIPTEEGALGFMSTNLDEKQHSMSRKDLIHQVAVCFAGREAEKMTPGLPPEEALNSGAVSDLAAATQIAFQAITELGMDANFGSLSLRGVPGPVAHELAEKAQPAVRGFLDEGKDKALHILTENQYCLEAIAKRLLKSGAIDGSVVKKLVLEHSNTEPLLGASEKTKTDSSGKGSARRVAPSSP